MPCSGDPSPQGTSSTLSSRHPSGMEPCWPVSPAHQHRWTAYPFPQRCVPWTPAALWVPSDGLGTSAIMEPKCPHGALPPSPGSGAGLHLRHLQLRQRAIPCHNHQSLFLLPDWELWPRTSKAHSTLPQCSWGPLVLCQAHPAVLTTPLLTRLHVLRQLLCPNPAVFSKLVFISKNLQLRGML